jgi:two-component system sensor histidine kinase/response regulator
MQGDLGVNSEEGKGSTFWFELPLKPAPESFREEASPIGGAVETLRTKHVLLVEDYPPNREIAKFFLSGTGLEVSIAENGAEAVSRVKENRFDLIIMDVQMPVMDGLAASREIRILENGKTVPIIGMTAHAFESDREKCLGAGMNYVITKPVDWPKAIIILQNALQGEIPAHPIEAAEATRPADAESPLDLTAYIQRMNGNKRVALDILAGFLRILPSDIANIAESLKTGNAREANRLAHSIKSGGANVCAAELSEAARRLEESLELGICDDASALWQKLNAVYGRLSDWATVNL